MRTINSDSCATQPAAPIQSLQSFSRAAGISAVTAWRFEKRGWIKTLNIAGRRYITAEAAADFIRRAQAGEFAKEHKTPLRRHPDPAVPPAIDRPQCKEGK